MTSARLLIILGPANEPLWVRVYVQPIGERRAAMFLSDTSLAPWAG